MVRVHDVNPGATFIAEKRKSLKQFYVRIDWRIWVGVLLLIACSFYLEGRLLPPRPRSYYGQIIYPLLLLRRNTYCNALYVGLAVFAFLGLLISVQHKQKLLKSLAIILVSFSCLLSCFASFAYDIDSTSASLTHIASIKFGKYFYHLAVTNGPNHDYDAVITAYLVYECDGIGISCRLLNVPYWEGNQSGGPPPYDTALIIDNDVLYAQIGGEKYRILELQYQ